MWLGLNEWSAIGLTSMSHEIYILDTQHYLVEKTELLYEWYWRQGLRHDVAIEIAHARRRRWPPRHAGLQLWHRMAKQVNSLAYVTRLRLRKLGITIDDWPPPTHHTTDEDPENTHEPITREDDLVTMVLEQATADALANLGNQFAALSIRVDPFDGSGNIQNFLDDLDRYMKEVGRTSDDEKLHSLIAHLTGDAKLWFRTLETPTWASLKGGLKERFGLTAQQKHAIKTRVFSAKQQPGETFKSYVGRLQQEARKIALDEKELLSIALGSARPHLCLHLAMAKP